MHLMSPRVLPTNHCQEDMKFTRSVFSLRKKLRTGLQFEIVHTFMGLFMIGPSLKDHEMDLRPDNLVLSLGLPINLPVLVSVQQPGLAVFLIF